MPPIWLTGISHSLNSARFLVVGKLAQQQFAADLLLVGEARWVDGRQAHQEVLLRASQSLKAFTE